MAKTERQGKVQHRWPVKFLDNDAKYFVCQSCKIRYFETQTEAFRYALPKSLAVFKILTETTYVKVELRPQTQTLISKKELSERADKVHQHNSRFDNSWTTRKSSKSKVIKKPKSKYIKFTK